MTPTPPLPADEARRLERLHALGILDTDTEPMFDTLASLASSLLGTPIALISFVDADRQWFKAELGLGGVRQTHRDVAFCAHTILQSGVFEVPDATLDERFVDNPLVTGAPGIRFYAAAPIEMPEGGERLGTLCVIDRQPRLLTDAQRQQLQMLAQLVAQALDLREQARRRVEVELAGHLASLHSVLDDLPVSVTVYDADLCNVFANAMHGRWIGRTPSEMLGRRLDHLMRPDRFALVKPHIDKALAGEPSTLEGTFTARGEDRQFQVQFIPHGQEQGRVPGFAALAIDVTAERHAQALRGRLAALVEHTDDAIMGLALDGTITDWNAGATRLFGFDETETLGRHCYQLLAEPDGDLLHDRIALLVKGEPAAPYETELRSRDGTVLPVSVVMSPILDREQGVVGVAKTVRDIRRLREAEAALRASQAFLDRTGRIAGVGGWEIDLRTEQVRWSDEVCRIHERPLGHRLDVTEGLGYFSRESRRLLRGALASALQGGGPFDMEAQMTTARGKALWVRMAGTLEKEDGVPVRCVGAMQDITVRRHAEIALEESRASFRTLYESTPALLQSIDLEGRILTVSDAWLTSLGYARAQVIGRPCIDFLLPASRSYAQQVALPEFFARGRADGVPLKMLRQDGQVMDVLWSAVLQRDITGQPQRGLMVIEDITEKLARTSELEREHQLRLQIERHARHLDELLTERSDMLRVLAHEVRQPLNNASAALQSAAAALAGTGKSAAAERLQRARDVMGHVLAGVDNTLAAASLLVGSGQAVGEDTDIDTLVAVALADLSPNDRARVQVLRETSTRTATMDMGLMRLALRNLLSNALKYAPPGSPVTVRLSDSDDPLALVIDVTDQGPGFEADLLPRMFERGARGRQAQHAAGHGLGLYIVRRVMERHGGQVEVLSNLPGTVTMRLVVTQASSEP